MMKMKAKNGFSRGLCTTVESVEEMGTTDGCRTLRLTLQDRDQPVRTPEQHTVKPIGQAVVQPPNERQPLKPASIKPTEEKVEVIKVYLKGRKQEPGQQQNLRMLSDEVSQIQEVRYCLKTLREQMAARNNNNNKVEHTSPANGFSFDSVDSQSAARSDNQEVPVPEQQEWEEEDDSARLREVSRRLFSRLQETEQRHHSERERLQEECGQYQQQLSAQTQTLQRAEVRAQVQDERVRELQRLLAGMQRESAALEDRLGQREQELSQLRTDRDGGSDQRVEELEKEQAILKEKIHHLDDMLKSQQRKVRHMIEQLQNSRTVIQERDRVIHDLQEKVAFLEAENRELHDQMDFYLGGQGSSSYQSPDHRGQIVYSKPLTPNGHTNKPLPFIKVIEIKS
ncbi:tuftelin-like isoform X1 [Conger conger]|uniref:tuftelin-like isoform X1 n=2 Tax=Conger conger TaxID=82655 RepID=UPI002A5ABF09|nr:tuftelin-like isoform X1 [Conger conger]